MQEFGLPGFSIELKKRIPIGAGLGGGSSDAAAVLLGGCKLYNYKCDLDTLSNLAGKIGSDVPFFLNGKTAHVTGRGEIIDPINIELKYYVLLVMPKLFISTPMAYKSHKISLTRNDNDYKFKGSNLHGIKIADFDKIFHNNFEKSIFEIYPELAEIKAILKDEKADFASLSGSGSAMYGIFSSYDRVQKAYNKLENIYNCHITIPIY